MIKLIKSTFYNERKTKKQLTRFIAKTKQLSCGPMVERFESQFASYQKRSHCIMVNSGSSANLALLQALLNLGYLKKGDTVGFSQVTWATNVMPIVQLGLQAVPIDVELQTLNISSKALKKVVTKTKLKALFITHLLGFCDDLEEIDTYCKNNNILLLEDTCESLGSVYKGKLLGNWGLASTFSFYVGHHLSTIEGGAVCTNDTKLATMLSLVRAHGWDRNLSQKAQTSMRKTYHVNSTFYSRYTFYDLGYNLRPTEIQGYLGSLQLRFADTIIKKRQNNYKTLAALLYQAPSFFPIVTSHMDVVSNFAIPLICKTEKIRDTIVERCNNHIETRPIVGGDITQQPFFQKYPSSPRNSSFKSNASLVHKQGLYVGNNPELTAQEKQKLINILTKPI